MMLSLWGRVKSVFGVSVPEQPPMPIKLGASTEAALSDSLKELGLGERGWITFDEADRLFLLGGLDSGMWNEEGKRALISFAANVAHRAKPETNLAEQRIYFTRKANWDTAARR